MPVFMITKGLVWDGHHLVTLPDVVERRLGAGRSEIFPAAIAGPCIAGELARRAPTWVVLTGRHKKTLDKIAELISAPYYHVLPSTDLKGTEICAALKNVFAMGIALAMGLHEKAGGRSGSIALHNLESAMFAESIREMRSLIAIVGGDPDTASGLAGVGDIDVTTNGGRTGKFGRLLGLGLGRAKAIEAMEGATLECLETLEVLEPAIAKLEEEGALKKSAFPLLLHLIEVALHDAEVRIPLASFFRS
jgi:glycerol-3-phosphate dehydrogenase (NAD(P)+)